MYGRIELGIKWDSLWKEVRISVSVTIEETQVSGAKAKRRGSATVSQATDLVSISKTGLIITFSVGLGSYTYRHKNGGHYVFSSGFLVMSLFLLWQSIFYFRMPVSTIASKW
nr:unnamed protein product [Spirometra erinaceieuropaei]